MNKNMKNISYTLLALTFMNMAIIFFPGTESWNRPLFNYDYSLALISIIFIGRWGIALLGCLFFIDIIVTQSRTYYFISVIDFIQSLKDFNQLNILSYLDARNSILILIACVCIVVALKLRNIISNKLPSAVAILCLCIILFILDIFNGTAYVVRLDSNIISRNIAGSTSYSFLKNVFTREDKRKITSSPPGRRINNRFDIINWAKNNHTRGIVIVVVESLGMPNSKIVQEWLHSNIKNNNFDLMTSQLEFKGSTTNGELRILCELEGSYMALNSKNSISCLPKKLSNMGWSTSAYHGFSKNMFNRKDWWPAIGFQKIYFYENFHANRIPKCGDVFRGVCDDELIKIGLDSHSGEKLTYILTLNTHLPVIEEPIPLDLKKICIDENISNVVCMHLSLLGNRLSSIVMQGGDIKKLPLIIIAGDHAPPFSEIRNRNIFSQNLVPLYILKPVR